MDDTTAPGVTPTGNHGGDEPQRSRPVADADQPNRPAGSRTTDRVEPTPASGDRSDVGDVAAVDDAGDSEVITGSGGQQRKRRRGSRGGQGRKRPDSIDDSDAADPEASGFDDRSPDELPEPIREGKVQDVAAAEKSLVRKPKIGDTRPSTAPMPSVPPPGPAKAKSDGDSDGSSNRQKSGKGRRKRGGKSGGDAARSGGKGQADRQRNSEQDDAPRDTERKRRRGGRGKKKQPSEAEQQLIEQRKGRERNGKPVGRYFMCVQVRPGMAQVAVLEGRNLIEHYVSRPSDDVSQIHGNIYLGRVQNVLPGMEAAFVDITTPKNAVLYRGDVQYDPEDIEEKGKNARIEDILKARQMIMCQVTKNPIGAKGARLTQEVSLPGRFVVLIPNSKTYGISKRLPDDTRKRLRNILDRVKPEQHGLIVRTAAEHATEADLEADMQLLLDQWTEIERKAAKTSKPTLLYREPELAVRVIREEFNPDYRGVVIDDRRLYEEVRSYVEAFNPELADRIEHYDVEAEGLTVFERFHVHEQVHKALDRKVWLPSGGSLIIEHTEALTVIDVNTGKNVGKSNLEETVFHNNMEAAEEIAKQLRLRDIGGIIVIDFIDMEIKDNRAKVVSSFRDALARDKTRTQVFDISELGLVEMTRKRIGEGLLTEFSEICPDCEGRGVLVDHSLLD
jgi:ribonuclease E